MKSYLVFAFPNYEAGGGWNDFVGSFDSTTDALKAILDLPKGNWDKWQIVEASTGSVMDNESWPNFNPITQP